MNTWHIDQGTIDGMDVSGLTLVALNKIHGHVLQGRPVVYYVDDKATDEQQEALLNVWTGKRGGPLADLSQLMGEVIGVERAAIAFHVNKGKGSLRVGKVIDARIAPSSHGGTDHSAVPHDDVCTTLPGSETHTAEAATYRVDSPIYGFDIELENYTVLEGHFRFEG